jgi:hypothetical protein
MAHGQSVIKGRRLGVIGHPSVVAAMRQATRTTGVARGLSITLSDGEPDSIVSSDPWSREGGEISFCKR